MCPSLWRVLSPLILLIESLSHSYLPWHQHPNISFHDSALFSFLRFHTNTPLVFPSSSSPSSWATTCCMEKRSRPCAVLLSHPTYWRDWRPEEKEGSEGERTPDGALIVAKPGKIYFSIKKCNLIRAIPFELAVFMWFRYIWLGQFRQS